MEILFKPAQQIIIELDCASTRALLPGFHREVEEVSMKADTQENLVTEKSDGPTEIVGTSFHSTTRIASILLLGLMLGIVAGSTAFAAQGGNGGGGGGGGNGGTGPDKGDLYGDAVYLLRNVDTGVPEIINGCIRPIMGRDGLVLAINADQATADYVPETAPESIEGWYNCEQDPQDLEAADSNVKTVIMADDDGDDELEACDVISRCLDYVEEADMGRLSILKAPERVLDRQLEEAISKFESGGEVSLDASGRPVVGEETFDSPLLNLALYREFHFWGAIVKNPLEDDEELVYDPGQDFILAAAFGLGAGDDKEDPGIDHEIAVRSAAIIGLGEQIHELALADSAVLPDSHKFEYEGTTSYYVNYEGFSYSRADTFPGNICYDFFDEELGDYVRTSRPIIEAVFAGDPVPYPVAEQLTGFAQAANDARRVLVFVHDNLVKYVDSVFEVNEITEEMCPPLN